MPETKAESVKHTPGPWTYFIDKKTRQGHIYGANNFKIHDLFNGTIEAAPMVEANARLMAASPDLLAACREAQEFLADLTRPDPGAVRVVSTAWAQGLAIESRLRAAIARATQPQEKGE